MAEPRDPIPLISPASRLTIITNSKCGGTSLLRWFLNRTVNATDRDPLSVLRLVRATGADFAWTYHLRGGRALHRDAGDAALRQLANRFRRSVSLRWLGAAQEGTDFVTLWVVRDPAERLLSAYLNKFFDADRAKRWVRDVVAEGGVDGSLSFAQFVAWLDRVENDTCNTHWRRQSYVAEPFRGPVHIARLEALADDLRSTGLPVLHEAAAGLEQRNRNRARATGAPMIDGAERLDQSALRSFRAKHGTYPASASFLTRAIRVRIARIYAADYARLPYSPGIGD